MRHFTLLVIVACALVLSGARARTAKAGGKEPTGIEKEERPLGFDLTGESILDDMPIDEAIKDGEIEGEAGVYFQGTDPDDPETPPPPGAVGNGEDADYFFGVGYLNVAFESASVNGLQFGIGGLALNQIWWDFERWDPITESFDGDVDYDDAVDDDALLHTAYVQYNVPNSKTSVVLGRKQFKESIVMDGSFHQGMELSVKDGEAVDVYFSAVEKWADADLCDLDEMMSLGEIEMNSLDSAGNWGYSLITDVEVENGVVTPFAHYHDNVVLVSGVSGKSVLEMDDDISITFSGAWSRHYEETPSSVSDDDEDWSQYLLHQRVDMQDFFVAGGYYKVSDGLADAPRGTGIFQDDFSPMERIGERNNFVNFGDETWADTRILFLELGYDFGPVEIQLVYGKAEDDSDDAGEVDSDANEIDLEVKAEITDRIAFQSVFADVDFDHNDENNDYYYWEGALSASF
ncbi:MAG: hypothetical protein ACLFWL_18165 [Candidatus Brocadiia bacterium]